MNEENLRIVAEDLEYLRIGWSTGMDDAELRRGTAILRRLLVDGGHCRNLLAAWRAAGFDGQPTVRVSPFPGDLEHPLKHVSWGTAGGLMAPGTTVLAGRTIVFDVGPAGPDGEPTARTEYDPTPPPKMRITDYVSAPCAVAYGEVITRREMIKYVANYLGGVHLGLGIKTPSSDKDMIRRIEAWLDRLTVSGFGKEGPYIEILAAGQALGRSVDMTRLVQRIRSRPGS